MTGDNTIFGRIAQHSAERRTEMTTLQKEILRFVLIITSAILFFSVVVIIFWASWLRVQHPGFLYVSGLVISLVSMNVAFIPLGIILSPESRLCQAFRWRSRCRLLLLPVQ